MTALWNRIAARFQRTDLGTFNPDWLTGRDGHRRGAFPVSQGETVGSLPVSQWRTAA